MITKQLVNVARPGTIVSTIVEGGHVETVTFITDRRYTPGFTTVVHRSDDASDAVAMHAIAVAVAR